MRSTPSPNPFDRLMGWLRLSRGEGPAWEGWARRACPPVLCSVFVFKRNLLRVSFHSAERFDCAKGRASRDLGPFAQIICGACGTGWGWGWRAQTRRSLATRREMRALYHSPRRNGRRDRIHPSLRFCVQDLVASFGPSFVKPFVERLAAVAGLSRGCSVHIVVCSWIRIWQNGRACDSRSACDPRFRSASGCH